MRDRDQVLMCPPDYFKVDYSINPWMRSDEPVAVAAAKRQWDRLHDAIRQVADVELMEPVVGLPDMVFTANAGVIYRKRVIVSHFRPTERRGEERHFKEWFERHGYQIQAWPSALFFEGAGDVLLDRTQPFVWAGYGQRTQRDAHEPLASFYPDRELVSLRLIDPHYYHVDTCLQPLWGGYFLYFPGAFDEEGIAEIERRIPPSRRLPVTASEAASFACNAVNLADQIVLNTPSSRLEGVLREKGFHVTGVDLSEFIKSGGSAKCLCLKLNEPDISE